LTNKELAVTEKTRPMKLVEWSIDTTTKVGTITLNSPETYNALTVEMGIEFQSLCQKIIYDLTTPPTSKVASNDDDDRILDSTISDVNVIVITGAGAKAFSAGGNLSWLHSLGSNTIQRNMDLMLQFYHSFLTIRKLPVPTIAALNGPAVGAGACLALACDLRTGIDNHPCLLGFPFVSLGIHAGMGGTHLLSQALGHRSTLVNEILLTGKMLSSNEALSCGIVNQVHENNSLISAIEMAELISSRHPVATRTMIQTLREQQDVGLGACLQREALAQAICYNRQDWGKGLVAASKKNDAIFDPYPSR
jgi:enoyl-CoA hydratase/carnithine racemase